MRRTNVADMQGVFRIIQSVPSPKAEPFKMWLAEAEKKESMKLSIRNLPFIVLHDFTG